MSELEQRVAKCLVHIDDALEYALADKPYSRGEMIGALRLIRKLLDPEGNLRMLYGHGEKSRSQGKSP
jgi:hypothetical protein